MTQCPQSHPLTLLSPETSLKPLDKSMFKSFFLELKEEPPTLPQLRKHQPFKAMGRLFRIPEFTSSAHFWLQQQEELWVFPLKSAAASSHHLLEKPPIDSTSRFSLGLAAEDHTARESRFIQVQPPSLAQRELYTHNSPQTSAISQLEKFL